MGSPIIWSGNSAKLLKPILDFFGAAQILSGTVDPTSVATSAPKGSIYLNTSTGLTYRKTDAGSSTNWVSGLTNPMTTGGDVIYGAASGVPTRLANGTAGQYLKSTGGTSAPVWSNLTAITVQNFTSVGAATYTRPSGCTRIFVQVIGGGGGGGGGGAGATTAGNGSYSAFGGTTGAAPLYASGGAGGNTSGEAGAGGDSITNSPVIRHLISTGSPGGGTVGNFFTGVAGGLCGGASGAGGGGGRARYNGSGFPGSAYGGGGGGGGSSGAGTNSFGGPGGGGGGYASGWINSPSASYAYTVGGGGTAGAAAANGYAGAVGADGLVSVIEFYD